MEGLIKRQEKGYLLFGFVNWKGYGNMADYSIKLLSSCHVLEGALILGCVIFRVRNKVLGCFLEKERGSRKFEVALFSRLSSGLVCVFMS